MRTRALAAVFSRDGVANQIQKAERCWRSICRMAHFTDTETTKRKLNRGVAWERFAHPHTDPQAQICHLQYVIYRACIRLLPSFSDFLSPTLRVSLLFFAPSHAQIFSQVIQITVAYLICHAWLSPQDYREGRRVVGFFFTHNLPVWTFAYSLCKTKNTTSAVSFEHFTAHVLTKMNKN